MKKILKHWLLIIPIALALITGANAETVNNFWIKGSNGELYTNSGNGQGNAIINVAGCNGCGGGGGGGITSLNGLTGASQTFATGTTGANFGIVSSGSTHTFNLPIASSVNTGKLSSTDWTTFNNKLSSVSTTGTVLTGNGTSGTPLGVATTDSVTSNASGLRLVNDSASPGNNFVYATNSIGAKAWISQSALVVPISSLADAVGNGVVNVGNNTLNWSWNTLTSGNGLNLTSTSTASTGISQTILNINLTGAHVAANVETTGLEVNNQHTGSGSKNVGIVAITGNGDDNYSILANNKVAIGGYASAPVTALPDVLTVGGLGFAGSVGIANSSFGKTVSIDVPTTNFTNWTLTLPENAGTADYVLKTDGSGNTSWVAQAGATSPGGTDTNVQFNLLGSFGASAKFSYDYTNESLILSNDTGAANIAISKSSTPGYGITMTDTGMTEQLGIGVNSPVTKELGIYTIVANGVLASFSEDYLGSGESVFFSLNRKIRDNITTSQTYFGDIDSGNQPYIQLDYANNELSLWGVSGGTPLKSLLLAGQVMSFGDVDGSFNSTRIVLDDSTQFVRTENTKTVSFGGAIATPTMQVESTGGSIVIADDVRGLYYDPASTQSGVTITLPANPVDGQEVIVSFGGQVTGGNVVTSLTISPNTGQTLLGNFSSSYADGGSFAVKYREANTTWYKTNSHTN